jgi:hypothetical protein
MGSMPQPRQGWWSLHIRPLGQIKQFARVNPRATETGGQGLDPAMKTLILGQLHIETLVEKLDLRNAQISVENFIP